PEVDRRIDVTLLVDRRRRDGSSSKASPGRVHGRGRDPPSGPGPVSEPSPPGKRSREGFLSGLLRHSRVAAECEYCPEHHAEFRSVQLLESPVDLHSAFSPATSPRGAPRFTWGFRDAERDR